MSRSVVRILPCVIAITMTPSVSGQCQLQQLVPGNRVAGDQYGDAVAVDGDWAVVGASRDDEPLSNSGSATIFEFDGLAWIEHSKITAADLESNDLFGWSVDLDADAPGGPLILVGAYLDDDPSNAGSAYLFRYDGNAWNQEAKLVASDASGGEEFGQSVALSGNVAVIGAAREDDGGTDRGAAYVYRRSGASWNEEAKLTPAARVDFDRFGIAVDVDATNPLAERIIVGASLHDPSGVVNAGGAWVFHSDGTTWQEYVLTAPDPMENDKFGEAVAIVGDTAVVGAFLDDDAASNAGSVFVFAWDGSSWTNDPPVILTALDAGADDQFDKAIDITPDGLSIVVGAALDNSRGI